MEMIKLPYEYKDYFDNIYKIVGWNIRGVHLNIRDPGGRIWIASAEDSRAVLKKLNLKPEQIPDCY